MTSSLREPDRAARLNARNQLEREGYVVVRDRDLGLDPAHREQIKGAFFNNQVLRRYPNDIPADRLRARDVVRYDWVDGELKFAEHGTIAIEARGGHAGRREFERVEVLYEPILTHWIREVLQLVPKGVRQRSGTFGVNFFRTFTDVVTKPHQDDEQFVIIYVIDKVGGGALTQLYPLEGDLPLFEHELQPGELIIFRDAWFRHNATPLVADGPARRDAMVCTVNYADTYDLG